jgi:hypothetical protein
VIREKKHQAPPMTIDDALYHMEMVGHDFYLFVDQASRAAPRWSTAARAGTTA